MSDKAWQCLKNITITILKLHLMALYLLLALWIAMKVRSYVYRDEPKALFDNYWIRGMIYIPEEIAKTKDCEQFFQWQGDHLPRMMHGKCPWYKYTDHYEVRIGSVELNIPRKYLFKKYMFVSLESERESYSITLENFIYPSMKIAGAYYPHDGFNFSIENYETNEPFKTRLEQYFWKFLSIEPYKADYKIEQLGFDQEVGKRKFKTTEFIKTHDGKPTTIERFFYTNDDVEKVEDFIVCDSDHDYSFCQSAFALDDVYVEYYFKHHLAPDAGDIKSKIIQLINQWRIK